MFMFLFLYGCSETKKSQPTEQSTLQTINDENTVNSRREMVHGHDYLVFTSVSYQGVNPDVVVDSYVHDPDCRKCQAAAVKSSVSTTAPVHGFRRWREHK
jgi:hypothetical protein